MQEDKKKISYGKKIKKLNRKLMTDPSIKVLADSLSYDQSTLYCSDEKENIEIAKKFRGK